MALRAFWIVRSAAMAPLQPRKPCFLPSSRWCSDKAPSS